MKVRSLLASMLVALVSLVVASPPAGAHFTDGFEITDANVLVEPEQVTITTRCTAGEHLQVRVGMSLEPSTWRASGYARAVCTGEDQSVVVSMTKEEGVFPPLCPPQTLRVDATGINKVGGEIHGKARATRSDVISDC